MGQPGVFTPGGTPPPGSLVGPSLGVPSVNPGEGGAFFRPVASPTPVPQGVLGTIQDWAVLTNNYKNVRSLQNFLDRFHTFQEGGLVNPVQVGQVEQTLLQSIEGVLTAHATYRVDYDEVKTQIGIPITVPLVFDDSLYRPIFRQLYRYETLATEYQAAIDANLALNRPEDLKQLRARLHQQLRDAAISRGTQSLQAIERLWAEWEKLPNQPPLQKPLNNRLRQLLEERRKLLDLNEAYAAKNQPLPEKDARRLDELELDIDVGKLERTLRGFEATLAKVGGQPIVTFRMVHRDFVTLFEWAYKEQEDKIRESWPALPPYCVNGVDILSADEDVALDTVARTALTNRVDLMNVRGELVDAWRKIAVTANSLLGTVNVQYHLDASTPAELAQPFDFSASRSRHELLFNLQPPLVRRAERNNYRSTLIAYQQMRRTLMGYEDNILYGVRFQLRSLRAVANNYQRIQRRAIELAYRQVGLALEAFNAPQIPTGPEKIPGLVGGPVQTSAGDPAALTNQLLTAQSNLVRAQNDLYTQWNGYLTTRLNQYRDLGLMPLDARGVWIDDVANCDCQPSVPGQPGPGPERPSREPPDQLPEPRPVPPAAGAPVGAGR
jgi:hypothetical protein